MEAESSEKETTRNWLELPRDLTSAILSKLGAVEILTSAQNVCTTWRNICKDPAMWRRIDMRNLGDRWNMDYNLEVMCRHAVDRSCGDLVYINVEFFGSDELLKYIADRASSLRHLRLVSCYSISDEGLIVAVAKLSKLEEIEISFCSFSEEVLAAIGRSCPLLKTFKYNSQGFKCSHIEVDEEAQAIAATMHELHHLYLFGNKLTNVGLSTILDGCPHLESLDLRQCFNINLVGELEKRCLERIKDLRRPNDPTDDYEFDASLNYEELSSEEGYPSGFSEIEYLSEDDYIYMNSQMVVMTLTTMMLCTMICFLGHNSLLFLKKNNIERSLTKRRPQEYLSGSVVNGVAGTSKDSEVFFVICFLLK